MSRKEGSGKMYCALCGKKIAEQFTFCPFCGKNATEISPDRANVEDEGSGTREGNFQNGLGLWKKILGDMGIWSVFSDKPCDFDQSWTDPDIPARSGGMGGSCMVLADLETAEQVCINHRDRRCCARLCRLLSMSIENILAALDDEIDRLQQVRSLLASLGGTKSLNTAASTRAASTPAKKRKWKMSADARKRIADAQRKRWAKQKAGK